MGHRFVVVTASIFLLAGSFFLTLWYLGEWNDPLAHAVVTDATSAASAAQKLGLHTSPDLRGSFDAAKRVSPQGVSATGWGVDLKGDGTALAVFVFSGGKLVSRVFTKGERPDVAAALKMSPGSPAVRNIEFSSTIACTPRNAILVVLTHEDKYLLLNELACP